MEEQGTGYITVNVRTAGGALPVEGAMITIKASSDGNDTVIAVMISDAGGASDVIALPTPPKENSLTPNGGEVSSMYTVDADKDGYYHVVITSVPVYDGVTTVQQILLVPIALGNGVPVPDELTRFSGGGNPPQL